MSNYIEYKNKIAFHPGYYIKEIVENSGLTQEDFAKRLDTSPKNLSYLIRGEQSISVDIAMKISRMLGTSVNYWLNLQNVYDTLIAEFKSEEALAIEKEVFKYLDYKHFKENYNLPDLPRQIEEQIKELRKFLNVSSLTVFTKKDMAVSFRSASDALETSNTVKANIMVQIATNYALNIDAPKYNKKIFINAVEYALTLTTNHSEFYPLIRDAFKEAGVILVILPNIASSKVNGATKKVGENIMLMVNDRRLYADSFWFTLFHEIGHILNGDYGMSFEKESGIMEKKADLYAQDSLIPKNEYSKFIELKQFGLNDIKKFANTIKRDPGIVLGRLQNDGFVDFKEWDMQSLKRQYKIKTGY